MFFNRIQTLVIFIFCLLVLGVTILNFNNFKGIVLGATSNSNGNLVIYDDQLQSGFADWSWDSDVNFNNTSPVTQGTKSIGFSPRPWGGLYFHNDTPVDLTKYTALHFSVYTTQDGQNITLIFYDANNKKINKTLPLSNYLSKPTVNTWNSYTVPMSDIIPAGNQIKGIAFQNFTDNAEQGIYFDDIAFVTDTAASSQSPAQAPSQSPSQSPAATKYEIYGDSLHDGWMSWSWDSQINVNNTYPVDQGNNSISFTPTAAWGGLYLHTDSGIDTTGYYAISFSAKATQAGQRYAVLLFDKDNKSVHDPITLDNYGGQPDASAWKNYTLPLTDFGVTNQLIQGIGIFDFAGHNQPPVYIDTIELISQNTTTPLQAAAMISVPVSQVPSPSAAQSVSPTQSPAPSQVTTTPNVSPAPTSTAPAANSSNPFSGATLFNNPDSNPAQTQADQWRSSRPADASKMDKIAGQPKGIWMGEWSGDIKSAVQSIVDKAAQANSVPVLIAYNIPNRDCGSYSAGGSNSSQAYQSWIDGFAAGIGSRHAAVILEPDALAQMTCLPTDGQQQRIDMLKYAIQKFKVLGNTLVYVDAAHSGWIAAGDMASRLKQAGIDLADGFALNVSNFDTDAASITYGQQISSLVGGKHFVIDTARNGNGQATDNSWCNPSGRALGDKPTTQTGNSLVDAYLWLKYPGESDGTCNGGPAAGVWYPDYALGLAQNAKW